jgi:hypothetical protein
MGYAHHSLRKHPIMFGFAETGSNPVALKQNKNREPTQKCKFSIAKERLKGA